MHKRAPLWGCMLLLLVSVCVGASGSSKRDSLLDGKHSTIHGHHHDPGNYIPDEPGREARWTLDFFDSAAPMDALSSMLENMISHECQFKRDTSVAPHHRSFHLKENTAFTSSGQCDPNDVSKYLRNFVDNEKHLGLRSASRSYQFKRSTRDLLQDIMHEPLWSSQWHLQSKDMRSYYTDSSYWIQSGLQPDFLSVGKVWKSGIFGRDVVVGIVDDGLDHAHPEFAQCYAPEFSHDFDGNDADPSPYTRDAHGTEAGALISARANGVCGVGVAPLSRLAGIRLIAEPISDAVEAHGLTYFDGNISIYSNSWGPPDDGRRLDGPGPLTESAMQRAVQEGRNGLGVVYVWAAGNGRAQLDSCNYDGFANNRKVIPVAAVDFFAKNTYYSEWCSSLLVSAPSSGSSGPAQFHGIATADLHGAYGNDPGDCTKSFGGTSAAAPMISGVVALMLEARPELSWRDVQHILMRTAWHNDPEHHSWTLNGAGYNVSHAYGFGVANASAAVSLAQQWTLLAEADARNYTYTQAYDDDDALQLPDNFANDGVEIQFQVDTLSNGTEPVEFVQVCLTVLHQRRGDLKVTLTSPSGTHSYLAAAHFDNNANLDGWCFSSRMIYGEVADGEWSLFVADSWPNGLTGEVLEATLIVYTYV
jgi:subtilisin family serine protease